MTKIISAAVLNLATPKAGAEHELLFNKPAGASTLKLGIFKVSIFVHFYTLV
jgi:hypothetical protein